MMLEPGGLQWSSVPDLDAEARAPMSPAGSLVLQIRADGLWAAVDHPNEGMRFSDSPGRSRPWPWEPDGPHWEIRPSLAIRVVGGGRWAIYLRGVLMGYVSRDDVARAIVSFYR